MRRFAPVLAVLPFALAGCGSSTPATSASPTAAAGPAWVTVKPGSATPSPVTTFSGSPKAGLPPVSFLPTSSACAVAWSDDIGQVLIPLLVTPAAGSLQVQWPNRYGNRYRVTAVPQALVSGAQPEPMWKTVNTGAECTGSATITGLKSGAAYIVWLDAPDTPRGLDNSRGLYSGRSGIVKPL